MKAVLIKSNSLKEFFIPEQCFISELWNTEGDESVSIARARIEPGVTTAPHFLENITERYLILQGKGRIEAGDLKNTEVNAGDVIVFPAGSPQSMSNIGDDDLIFYAICTPRFRQNSYHGL